jgi:hypothetical protein
MAKRGSRRQKPKPRKPSKAAPSTRVASRADYAKWFASRGGKARAKRLTTEERRAIGLKGAEARWGTKRPKT